MAYGGSTKEIYLTPNSIRNVRERPVTIKAEKSLVAIYNNMNLSNTNLMAYLKISAVLICPHYGPSLKVHNVKASILALNVVIVKKVNTYGRV